MKNTKEFIVRIEKEIKVSLDMDKYTPETLKHINDYWGYVNGEFEDDEIYIECAMDIAKQFLKSNQVGILEGFPPNGQSCKELSEYLEIDEK